MDIPLRYTLPSVGKREFHTVLGQRGKGLSPTGEFRVLEYGDVEPFIREAEILLGLSEWRKAEEILAHLYVPGVPLEMPAAAAIAVDYAYCLDMLGKPSEAVAVLDHFSSVASKPPAYYVNMSAALLHYGAAPRAEHIARDGLRRFPDEPGLYGNLAGALLRQDRLPEALENAQRHLSLDRNVHSLEEVAGVLATMARGLADQDLPKAAQQFGQALRLLREAKDTNPKYLTARASLANVLLDLSLGSEAAQEALEILNEKPTLAVGLVVGRTYARALDLCGRHRECMEFCSRWLSQIPDDIGLQRIRAETTVDGFCIGYEQNGERIVERSSLEFFEKTVTTSEARELSDLLYLARLREWMGEVDSARRLAAHAGEERPDWWEPPFVLAGFEWHAGDIDACERLLHAAASLAPWRPQPWRLLVHVLRGVGRIAEAEAASSKANNVAAERERLLRRAMD